MIGEDWEPVCSLAQAGIQSHGLNWTPACAGEQPKHSPGQPKPPHPDAFRSYEAATRRICKAEVRQCNYAIICRLADQLYVTLAGRAAWTCVQGKGLRALEG